MVKKPKLVDQLKDVTKLAVEATRHVTEIVESMHNTIGGGPEILGRPLEKVTRLMTAPTYGAIRGVTNIVGAGLELAVSKIEPLIDQAGAERGSLLAAINGVVGDYLAATGNSLAIEMRLCLAGQPIELSSDKIRALVPESRKILLLMHGSCLDESSWLRKGHDHGAALAAEFGYVPLYLRYNSGLHISENGRALAAMLENLLKAWPWPVEDFVILAHSMGGLVARSACLVASEESLIWRSKLKTMITMGCPHHGAPLERSGNWVDQILEISRYSSPFARLGRIRSAGVTDLRYGNVLDEHWIGRDRFARMNDPRESIQLPDGVACFTIAATTASSPAKILPGDGLVPVESALGQHKNPFLALDFKESHRCIAWGTNHLGLLSSKFVYQQLVEWLRADSTQDQRTVVMAEELE